MRITWARGETCQKTLTVRDKNGADVTVAFDRAQIRIAPSPASCIEIEATAEAVPEVEALGQRFVFRLDDETLSAVRAGPSRFTIWLHAASGWRRAVDDGVLIVEEGC